MNCWTLTLAGAPPWSLPSMSSPTYSCVPSLLSANLFETTLSEIFEILR